MVSKKIADQGITLTARQRKTLKKQLANGNYSQLRIDSWRFWDRRIVQVEFTDRDLATIEAAHAQWVDELPQFLESMSETLAPKILATLMRNWPAQARHQHRLTKGFRRRLARRWQEPLSLLEMFVTIALEFGEATNVLANPQIRPLRNA